MPDTMALVKLTELTAFIWNELKRSDFRVNPTNKAILYMSRLMTTLQFVEEFDSYHPYFALITLLGRLQAT